MTTLTPEQKDRVVELARGILRVWDIFKHPCTEVTVGFEALRAALDPPKPSGCPICGDEPRFDLEDPSHVVQHFGHDHLVKVIGRTQAEAIANWNRRAT